MGEDELTLKIGEHYVGWGRRKQASQLLQQQFHQQQLEVWKSSLDQGKTVHSILLHASSNAWLHDGKYVIFLVTGSG